MNSIKSHMTLMNPEYMDGASDVGGFEIPDYTSGRF